MIEHGKYILNSVRIGDVEFERDPYAVIEAILHVFGLEKGSEYAMRRREEYAAVEIISLVRGEKYENPSN